MSQLAEVSYLFLPHLQWCTSKLLNAPKQFAFLRQMQQFQHCWQRNEASPIQMQTFSLQKEQEKPRPKVNQCTVVENLQEIFPIILCFQIKFLVDFAQCARKSADKKFHVSRKNVIWREWSWWCNWRISPTHPRHKVPEFLNKNSEYLLSKLAKYQVALFV